MGTSDQFSVNNIPSWLPEMFNLSGDWQTIIETLYDVFKRDFIDKKTFFDDREIWWNRKLDKSYPIGFWHLVEKENKQAEERQYDPRRAERLPWCSPVITNNGKPEIKVWDYDEGRGKINTYIWLENLDYLVVVHKKDIKSVLKVAFLVTAFYVKPRTKRNLYRKYENRVV